MDKIVIKRDGSEESFDKEKIARVVMAAGLPADKARDLATGIEQWVELQDNAKISSLQIRDQVLHLLKNVDQPSANMFDWYQKTKEQKSA